MIGKKSEKKNQKKTNKWTNHCSLNNHTFEIFYSVMARYSNSSTIVTSLIYSLDRLHDFFKYKKILDATNYQNWGDFCNIFEG